MLPHMKKAIICGSSQGIGLAFVKKICGDEDFKNVIALYRGSSDASHLRQIQENHPQLELVEFEATQESHYPPLLEKLPEGAVDLVINCVGTLHNEQIEGPERKIEEIEASQLMHSFEVNSLPTALLAKHLKEKLRKSEAPAFISLSAKVGSIGDNGMGGWYSYRASKAALNMLIKGFSIEMKRIHPQSLVVAMHPGTTKSRLSEPFLASASRKYEIHTADETAHNLWEVYRALNPADDTGKFLNWDGSELPW